MPLPNRQIEELQQMAIRLEKTDDFDNAIESFSKFAEELKSYCLVQSPNKKVDELLHAMPVIDFKKSKTTVANTFIKFLRREKNREKNKATAEAQEVASKFGLVM